MNTLRKGVVASAAVVVRISSAPWMMVISSTGERVIRVIKGVQIGSPQIQLLRLLGFEGAWVSQVVRAPAFKPSCSVDWALSLTNAFNCPK